MAITVKCILCGLRSEAADYDLGNQMVCTACGTEHRVEHAPPEAPVPLDLQFRVSDVPVDYRPKSLAPDVVIPGAPIFAAVKAPLVVRIYSVLYSIVSVLGILVTLAGMVYVYTQVEGDSTPALSALGCGFVVYLVFYFIASGLRNRRQIAVYGLCLHAMLALTGAFVLPNTPIPDVSAQAASLARFIGIAIIYLPPMIGAFNNWEIFQ